MNTRLTLEHLGGLRHHGVASGSAEPSGRRRRGLAGTGGQRPREHDGSVGASPMWRHRTISPARSPWMVSGSGVLCLFRRVQNAVLRAQLSRGQYDEIQTLTRQVQELSEELFTVKRQYDLVSEPAVLPLVGLWGALQPRLTRATPEPHGEAARVGGRCGRRRRGLDLGRWETMRPIPFRRRRAAWCGRSTAWAATQIVRVLERFRGSAVRRFGSSASSWRACRPAHTHTFWRDPTDEGGGWASQACAPWRTR